MLVNCMTCMYKKWTVKIAFDLDISKMSNNLFFWIAIVFRGVGLPHTTIHFMKSWSQHSLWSWYCTWSWYCKWSRQGTSSWHWIWYWCYSWLWRCTWSWSIHYLLLFTFELYCVAEPHGPVGCRVGGVDTVSVRHALLQRRDVVVRSLFVRRYIQHKYYIKCDWGVNFIACFIRKVQGNSFLVVHIFRQLMIILELKLEYLPTYLITLFSIHSTKLMNEK